MVSSKIVMLAQTHQLATCAIGEVATKTISKVNGMLYVALLAIHHFIARHLKRINVLENKINILEKQNKALQSERDATVKLNSQLSKKYEERQTYLKNKDNILHKSKKDLTHLQDQLEAKGKDGYRSSLNSLGNPFSNISVKRYASAV